MRTMFACVAAAAVVAGCQTATTPKAMGPQAPSVIGAALPSVAPTRQTRSIAGYRCEDGTAFTATFLISPDAMDLHFPSGSTVRLTPEPAGSGFSYRNAFHSLHGKGEEAIYTFGRRAPTTCRVTK